MTEMNLRISQMQGSVPVTVMHVSGDIDASSHQALDDKADELINGGARQILLDLSQNAYMSSAGLRSMHKILTSLNNSGDDAAGLKLLNPSDKVKSLMKTMGFDQHLPVFGDLNEALRSF